MLNYNRLRRTMRLKKLIFAFFLLFFMKAMVNSSSFEKKNRWFSVENKAGFDFSQSIHLSIYLSLFFTKCVISCAFELPKIIYKALKPQPGLILKSQTWIQSQNFLSLRKILKILQLLLIIHFIIYFFFFLNKEIDFSYTSSRIMSLFLFETFSTGKGNLSQQVKRFSHAHLKGFKN